MKIGAMNHPARNPLEEIDWFGQHGFDFVDFTLEPPAADPTASAYQTRFRIRTSVRNAVLIMHEVILPRRLSLAG